MIKKLGQAYAIQQRRVAAGKRGYAKAVRRHAAACAKANGTSYRDAINALPVAWPEKTEPKAVPARGRAA